MISADVNTFGKVYFMLSSVEVAIMLGKFKRGVALVGDMYDEKKIIV